MRKRRIILVLIAVGVLVGVVAVVIPPREPSYQGKRLSEWVLKLSRGVRVDDAERAMFSIGTNGIPYLVEWINYEPPAWKTRSIALLKSSFRWNLIDHKAERAQGAVIGFVLLAKQAHGAAPRLALLMNDTTNRLNSARRAEAVFFAGIEFYGTALVRLLRDSDPDLRIAATNALRQIDPQALEYPVWLR